MRKFPHSRFHFVFSLIMGAIMVFLMTFVVTLANLGWRPDFVVFWARAFAVAYVVAVPVIYLLAPVARRLAGRWVEMP